MVNFTEIPLPGHIFMRLPFQKAIDEKGTIQKSSNFKISGFELLSSIGALGNPEMLKVLVEDVLKRIIEDMAEPMITRASLESFFNQNGAIPIPGRPGVFLKKESLIFEET